MKEVIIQYTRQNEYFFSLPPLGTRGDAFLLVALKIKLYAFS
jgi:hypothetical protein